MKVRIRNLFAVVFTILILVAGLFVYREYDERRMIRDEEALKSLPIDALEIKGATLEESLRIVTEKVRSLGHRDLQLHVYPDGRSAPCFHARSRKFPFDAPPDKPNPLDLRIVSKGEVSEIYYGDSTNPLPPPLYGSTPTSVTFGDVLRVISLNFNCTCALRGEAVEAVRASGTMQRYRRVTFYAPWLRDISDAEIPAWLEGNGIQFYDGMTVKYDRQGSWLQLFGPADQADLLEIIVTPSDTPWSPTRWGMMKYRFYDWRKRVLGF